MLFLTSIDLVLSQLFTSLNLLFSLCYMRLSDLCEFQGVLILLLRLLSISLFNIMSGFLTYFDYEQDVNLPVQ